MQFIHRPAPWIAAVTVGIGLIAAPASSEAHRGHHAFGRPRRVVVVDSYGRPRPVRLRPRRTVFVRRTRSSVLLGRPRRVVVRRSRAFGYVPRSRRVVVARRPRQFGYVPPARRLVVVRPRRRVVWVHPRHREVWVHRRYHRRWAARHRRVRVIRRRSPPVFL